MNEQHAQTSADFMTVSAATNPRAANYVTKHSGRQATHSMHYQLSLYQI